MKFTIIITSRWGYTIKASVEIEAPEGASERTKRGLAIKSALLSGSDLSGCDLSRCDLSGCDLRGSDLSDSDLRDSNLSRSNLSGSNLRGSDLSRSNLRGSNLRDSNLSGSTLRSFKADFWSILLQSKPEVPGLIAALREGRINGSSYEGACACLVGTIANVRGVPVSSLERDSSRPAEQWFLMIHKGDKPGDDSGGGFAAKKALEWATEFCGYAGITLPDAEKAAS